MFKDAKVGDRVFNYVLQEWGVIVDEESTDEYPICVQFKKGIRTFTLDGYEFTSDKVPVLFWDEVKPIVPPKKPLPKLEVDTKVLVWNGDIDAKLKRYFSHFDETGTIHCFISGVTSWSNNGKNTIAWEHWELAEES